ncbi:two-component sensor histidine kinase [Chryseobacterium sp. T16E-39]|uniref:sensor histidine kinase n=1 Tax=Chryseobacterium sp. T16E-39 TaxID=2015076 RepID=UPI000B5B0D17|nr:HAMP domain-containing sensor histidine kinase [Chryseobacterium sp. T16E-39]ASK31762.1 two-component sensor histidine kinase [Chryseobacterium sp. T16E-39]
MISKSKNLISLFTTVFLLLLGIQGYFMYKTYQVTKRDVYKNVYNKLTIYTDDLEDNSGLRKVSDDSLQHTFILYHQKKISKKVFLNLFEEARKRTKKQFSLYVDKQFEKEGYKVAVKIEYLSIVFLPTNTNLIDKPITLFETDNKLIKAGISKTGRWQTSSTSRSDSNQNYDRKNVFVTSSETGFEILNIKSIIFREMTLLILCCVALLSSVLLLYLFTFNNLIRQQKQVEVLHTVVDNISHEFKTPIATLKIASKALKKNLDPETLPLIDRQIMRLENLMSQLHSDEGEGDSTIKPEDWDFFIQDLVFTYPDIQFILKNEATQELSFKKSMMETIIKNLCENSVKYGASSIQVSISHLSQHLEIKVSDDGQGMEKKELKNIFEKFYRIQSNNIHNTKGLGLGLYFIQKIIEKYNGKIEVMSQLKEGTTFKIRMPYEN